MDADLARTFLMVASCGSFLEASERLHLTQSTVSMRIKRLEDEFGLALFVRGRNGARLTQAGQRLHKHATELLHTINRAHEDLGDTEDFRLTLNVGARFGIWESFLSDAMARVERTMSGIALRSSVGFEDDLTERISNARLDCAFMYTPENRGGMTVEKIVDEELILARSSDLTAERALRLEGLVHTDWGPDFARAFTALHPDAPRPFLSASIGWLSLRHVLLNGGCGYFPRRIVNAHVRSGAMAIMEDAPSFPLPVYAVLPGRQGRTKRSEAALSLVAACKDAVQDG
ncbi:LysR family transcriptional regulator [Pacificispira sp.]|uniref:LysR family transcriptional regulator n=1 Tax=Pacificispira sp. TaxID=2888761 RepID=UPI003BACA99A